MRAVCFIVFCVLFLLYSCGDSGRYFPENRIDYGTATLSVELDGSIPDSLLNNPIFLNIFNSLSGDFTVVAIPSSEVSPRVCTVEIPVWFTTGGNCMFDGGTNQIYASFYLAPNKITGIRILMSGSGKLAAEVDMPLVKIASEELDMLAEIVFYAQQSSMPDRSGFPKGADGDIIYIQNWIGMVQDYILKQGDIPSEIKDMAKNWASLSVMNLYLEARGHEIPPMSSFVFLKDLELNDPRHLYFSYDYFLFVNQLLYRYSTDLPPIGETSPDKWLEMADKVIGDWAPREHGLFYDILVMVNYARQLTFQAVPFSPAQIKNMDIYFKNNAYVEVLLNENRKLIERNRFNARYDITTSELPIPDVPLEELLDTIIGQYDGQVVFVDFWATWCGPCLAGIESMKPIKESFAGKDVVFVYITNETSPTPMFEKAIKNIPGSHYRLTRDTMAYLLDYYFHDRSIPQYLIFDKTGRLAQTMSSADFNVKAIRQTIENMLNPLRNSY